MTLPDNSDQTLITLTCDIVCAHLSNNGVATADIPNLIGDVYRALASIRLGPVAVSPPEPAVSVRSSIKPDYLVCLEDGKRVRMLKRYLMTRFNLTPEAYRERWNLPADYPMVAPAYSERRREIAKEIGLGRNPNQRRGRPKKGAGE